MGTVHQVALTQCLDQMGFIGEPGGAGLAKSMEVAPAQAVAAALAGLSLNNTLLKWEGLCLICSPYQTFYESSQAMG
jgi:hypothetical protein